jgi:hypothetical protein
LQPARARHSLPSCTPAKTFSAVKMPGGRIVCAGAYRSGTDLTSAEVWGLPASGAPNTALTWRELPAMSVKRNGCRGCVMSDGRFTVLGGLSDTSSATTSSREALVGDEDDHWTPLPPMHHARHSCMCAAVAKCILVAGGQIHSTDRGHLHAPAEVYDEVRNR